MDSRDISEIKEKIMHQVNIADPWSLIEMGAPDDEYNAQIDRIVSILVNQKPDQDTLEIELHGLFRTKEHKLDNDKIKELANKLSLIKLL